MVAKKKTKAKKASAKKSKKTTKKPEKRPANSARTSAKKSAKAAVKMVPAKKAEAALDDPQGGDLRGAEATAAARTRNLM
jgi:hypothetical protein